MSVKISNLFQIIPEFASNLLQPEGETIYKSKGVLIDLREGGEFSQKVNLVIPDDAVPDSTFVEVSVVGKDA